ncbi:hypothetical protein ACERNI_01545 [Camelimonas sp. ID_303_24]
MAGVMMKFLAAAGAAAALSACSHPGPGIQIWDHPLDVRHCRKVAEVSPPTSTAGGFGPAVQGMAAGVRAAGGTDLYLRRDRHDWSVTTGYAYDCSKRPASHRHHSHKIVKD